MAPIGYGGESVTTITVSAVYDPAPTVVWAELRHIERHVEWMHDAVAIAFLTERHEGIGTRFRCDTKVGPLHTADLMTITEWVENTSMGVSHHGIVAGEGRFTLTPAGLATQLTWSETLRFPWWLGGPLGAEVAKPVLRALWRRNLEQFGRQLAERSD